MTLNISGARSDVGCDSETLPEAGSPNVRIVVQPVSAHRFRYKSEGRWAGSIPGVKTNTYPTIEISGCSGKAVIVVSCVTKDTPYRPHPHGVVARELYRSEEEIKKGVCKIEVDLRGGRNRVTFRNIGIQSTTRNEVKEMLKARKSLRVDPFNNGFSYGHLKNIDLNAVRLCFQVVILDENRKPSFALPPVVSKVIRDKKTVHELSIVRISHVTGSALGGTSMILLCKKVKPDDTAVVFFERKEGRVEWEEVATDLFVHQNCAIAFTTPPYHNVNITTPVKVNFQLKQISSDERSAPEYFEYIPTNKSKAKDKLASIMKKPLPTFLQTYSRYTVIPAEQTLNQIPNKVLENLYPYVQQTMMMIYFLQTWPDGLPPMDAPGPSRINFVVQNSSMMKQNHFQINHIHQNYYNTQPKLPHHPPASLLPLNSVSKTEDMLPSSFSNGDVRMSSENFFDVIGEEISDDLSGLSLKDLIGGESNLESDLPYPVVLASTQEL
ncbi:embryonic polarity protein dorsal-like [Battus philenor]|uniref:embryonic polarity protein dorsal-like n=1 Tax=Battus philenor TaxID=42288 RepID=UPI0035CF7657